jgi:hypothetical protein
LVSATTGFSLAITAVENKMATRLKLTTSKDLKRFKYIPISKFAAKIGIKFLKSLNSQ